MQRFKTLKTVELHAGILELTKEQAAARKHSLQDLGEGLYEITGPVQFKAGEGFGYDGELTKAMAQDLKSTSAKKKERR